MASNQSEGGLYFYTLLRKNRILDNDIIPVAEPKIFVSGQSSLDGDNVADVRDIGGCHHQIMRVIRRISGTVLNMEPVPSHNLRIYLHNLPPYGDFLFVQGGSFREKSHPEQTESHRTGEGCEGKSGDYGKELAPYSGRYRRSFE